jgi:metallo-beta-lactamase family protein
LGATVSVRAEVVDIPASSVHSDREDTIDGLASAESRREMVYVVHGDHRAAVALIEAIMKHLGWNAVAPHHLEQVRLD